MFTEKPRIEGAWSAVFWGVSTTTGDLKIEHVTKTAMHCSKEKISTVINKKAYC
jgi:hypothetical protein